MEVCSVEKVVEYNDFSSTDDSTLAAMLDVLREGTLLATLNDPVFHNLVADAKDSWAEEKVEVNVGSRDSPDIPTESLYLDLPMSVMLMDDTNSELENGPLNIKSTESIYQYPHSSTSQNSLEDRQSDISIKGQEISPHQQQLLDCVKHDHCYTECVNESENKRNSSCSNPSDSLEEGTNSDGGRVLCVYVVGYVDICVCMSLFCWRPHIVHIQGSLTSHSTLQKCQNAYYDLVSNVPAVCPQVQYITYQ